MKCLVINGSPSKTYVWNGEPKTGYTSKLTEQVLNALAMMGDVEFAELRLLDAKIPACLGCYRCFNLGEEFCPHYKQMKPLIDMISAADCIIFMSPVYAMNVTGLMKTFIDHASYFYHRPRFFDKKALIISSANGAGASKVCKYLDETLTFWGFNKIYKLKVLRHGADNLTINAANKCHNLAERLYTDTASGKRHRPSVKKLVLYNVWRGMALSDPATIDGKYWTEHDMDRAYAPGIRLNPLQKVLGTLLGKIMKGWMQGTNNS